MRQPNELSLTVKRGSVSLRSHVRAAVPREQRVRRMGVLPGFEFLVRFTETAERHRIRRKERCCASLGLDGFNACFTAFCVATKHGNLRTCCGHAFRQRSAEHARGTDDDCDFPREIKKFHRCR